MRPRLRLAALLLVFAPNARAEEPLRFERIVIDDNFPGGYQVEVADVNGDRKPDVVALGGSTLAWYENPTWTKRIVTSGKQTPGVISSATADLDGDGKAEIAIAYEFGMNEPTKGKLLLAVQGETPDAPWTLKPIADIGSIHRLRWGDMDGDGRLDLIVAPIFGLNAKPPGFSQDAASLTVYDTGEAPKEGRWTPRLLAHRKVLHAIEVLAPAAGKTRLATVLTAASDGVGWAGRYPEGEKAAGFDRPLVTGADGPSPKRGSSEVHLGRLADGRKLLATIEPWHGSEVVVHLGREPGVVADFGPRTVIDATLNDGHALWLADVDGDGTDEIFAGHRGKDARVSVYRFDGKTWNRAVLDAKLTAQDLRGGDIDGDGTPDIVAIGGQSRNIVWFRPIRGVTR